MSLYTYGNWTIDRMYNDTISTPKEVSVPDLSYTADFSKRGPIPGRVPSKNVDELTFTNNTGASVTAPENLIYGREPVRNIYTASEIDPIMQMAQKGAHHVYLSTQTNYSGVNSVSGQEVIIPLKGSIHFYIPDAPFVTEALVADFAMRLFSKVLGTNETGAQMIGEMLRGDLDPRE